MKTLKEDLFCPMIEVERGWLRKIGVITWAMLFMPLVLVASIGSGFYEFFASAIIPTWKGRKSSQGE